MACDRCKRPGCALVLAGAGVVLFTIGIVMSGVLLKMVYDGIEDEITLTDHGTNYHKWADSSHKGVAPNYWRIHLWNLTNPVAVSEGKEPVYVEVGPYVYRKYKHRFMDTWKHGNKEVQYKYRNQYIFEPELSTGSGSDQITNLWLPYYEVIEKAGSEFFLDLALPQMMLEKSVDIVVGLMCGPGQPVKQDCVTAAVEQWASLSGFTSSTTGATVAAGHTYATSPSVQEILGMDPETAVIGKLLEGLVTNMNLYPEFAAFTKFNTHTNATITPEVALALLYGGEGSPFKCPLLKENGNCCLKFVGEYSTNKTKALEDFPLSPEQAEGLFGYLGSAKNILSEAAKQAGAKHDSAKMWVTRTPDEWAFDFPDPLMAFLGIDPPNSAFFHDNYTTDAECIAAGGTTAGNTTVLTGKGDARMAQYYSQWGGYTDVMPTRNGSFTNPGVFCNGDVPVRGHMDTQMPLGKNHWFTYENGFSKDDLLEVWVDDVYRPIWFEYWKDSTLHGIDTWRFKISKKSLEVDPLYSQYVYGLVNLTCPNGGTPIYLTEPRYLHANIPSDQLPPGIAGTADPEKHETYLAIDPITGATLSGRKRLQVNVLVSKPAGGISKPMYLPVLWVEVAEDMTSHQADTYHSKITFAFNLQKGLLYSLTIVGGLFLVVGVARYLYLRRKGSSQRSLQYEEHYEESLLAPNLMSQ